MKSDGVLVWFDFVKKNCDYFNFNQSEVLALSVSDFFANCSYITFDVRRKNATIEKEKLKFKRR